MKVKGYTILEMLVVMALSGLVLALGWGVYGQMELYGRAYTQQSFNAVEWQLADRYLRHDAFMATQVSSAHDTVYLSGGREVIWWQEPGALIRREKAHTDTFALPVQSFVLHDSSHPEMLILELRPDTVIFPIRYPLHLPATAIDQTQNIL